MVIKSNRRTSCGVGMAQYMTVVVMHKPTNVKKLYRAKHTHPCKVGISEQISGSYPCQCPDCDIVLQVYKMLPLGEAR